MITIVLRMWSHRWCVLLRQAGLILLDYRMALGIGRTGIILPTQIIRDGELSVSVSDDACGGYSFHFGMAWCLAMHMQLHLAACALGAFVRLCTITRCGCSLKSESRI